MIAVVPVRSGTLPLGTARTAHLAAGNVLLAGEGTENAAGSMSGAVQLLELGQFAPAGFSRALAPLVGGEEVVLLPASADGRDLAPRLAAELGRPLLAGAVEVTAHSASVVRLSGSQLVTLCPKGPFVATVQPARAAEPPLAAPLAMRRLQRMKAPESLGGNDAECLEVLAPDPSGLELTEAERILAVGGGIGEASGVELASDAAELLGAPLGATRVATDRRLVEHSRQIGTTGVTVSPRLYLAFGISGASQHLAGIGDPAHVVSVNSDPSCPMAKRADLAIVGDASEVLAALVRALGERAGSGG